MRSYIRSFVLGQVNAEVLFPEVSSLLEVNRIRVNGGFGETPLWLCIRYKVSDGFELMKSYELEFFEVPFFSVFLSVKFVLVRFDERVFEDTSPFLKKCPSLSFIVDTKAL